MPLRSYSDVPNRIVRLFLQKAGRQYDANRGHPPFRSMNPDLTARFGNRCAYCGILPSERLVEERLVPMNRQSVGLHARGNVVPACKSCNELKAGNAWQEHPQLDTDRRRRIEAYAAEYAYHPNVTELRLVLGKLYELADRQTRALAEFSLIASRPHIAGLQTSSAMYDVGE